MRVKDGRLLVGIQGTMESLWNLWKDGDEKSGLGEM